MSSAKQFVPLFVVAIASAFATSPANAVNLVVNHDSQRVQSPAAPASGISYVQSGGNASTFQVFTEGYIFCANASGGIISEATFQPAHEDSSFASPHLWHFPTVTDLLGVSYSAGVLQINRQQPTSLFCRSVGAEGEVGSALSEGIFDNGADSATEINYNNLVNWIPPAGFSWQAPDWTVVPTDACDSNASPRFDEDAACGAVSGVRVSTHSATGVRAATMWTAQDGINFTYLVRFDGRFGPQAPNRPSGMQLPATSAPDTVNSADFKLRDAYDANFLSAAGHYCYLTALPTTLTSNVCNGAPQNLDLPLDSNDIVVQPPPLGTGSLSFYVAVVRQIGSGSHPNYTTPVVALAVLADPALAAEGGDNFIGDDVVFGFMPSSTGFPWMTGQ